MSEEPGPATTSRSRTSLLFIGHLGKTEDDRHCLSRTNTLVDMNLEGCKETMRDAHGKQNEGTERPVEAIAADGHPEELPENDALEQLSNPPQANDFAVGERPRSPSSSTSAFSSDTSRSSSSASLTSRRHSRPSTEAVVIPPILNLTDRELQLLRTAKRDPPVTKKTLSELDLPRILSNIHLRMDANFDRDLHFKPDLNGDKGRRKRKEASEYWEALATEITICTFAASEEANSRSSGEDSHGAELRTFEPRLPTLFETLQKVLKTLVPEEDHPSIMQNLDVSLLMQQIRKGVLDLIFLAKWLAALLKTHCAPMRDEWADNMVEQITAGFHAQDSRDIVRGLQTMFAILEAMKLDVANYQIRALRAPLVESTVSFLQDYFRARIERDFFSVEASLQWYDEIRERELRRAELKSAAGTDAQQDSFWPVAVMFEGLLDLLLQYETPEAVPETFIFDAERLWQLRSSLQNMLKLDICWHILETYLQRKGRSLPDPKEETYITFCARIWSLLLGSDDDEAPRGSTHRWLKNAHNVALEIARFATAACRPRDEEGSSTTADLIPDEVITSMETALVSHLSNQSNLFEELQRAMREKLTTVTFDYAKKYLTMSPLAICESQRSVPIVQRSAHPKEYRELDRIGMRLAHMGALHWRVWGPILYIPPEETSDMSSNGMTDDEDDGQPLLSRMSD